MDDLLLFTSSKRAYIAKLEDLLKCLLKNGLKISPRKCQLLETELQYMGNVIFIKDRKDHLKPLRSTFEAIQKLRLPTTPKGCKSFAGMVKFLIMFCPELQRLLKLTCDLTKKGRELIWGREQQEVFEEIKWALIKAPVLHIPNCEGRFHLYSDTNKIAARGALYQIQNGKPRLIAYASKRLPETVRSYLITELELCGLAINIASFSHLLKTIDFDTIVDHLTLMHIIKGKAEPATTRIKRLLELISSYSFNLYYMKEKDMILSDFLWRQTHDHSKPHDIILISFNMHKALHKHYYKIKTKERYLVQTWSQTNSSGVALPEVYGAMKTLDMNILHKKQKIAPQNKKILKINWD